MRIAIVGSRGYDSLELVRQYVRSLPKDTVVVSGGAHGVDNTAADTAVACHLETIVYLPDWKTFGKSAGFKRNSQIVNDCDLLVAFWDGVSRGTKDSMDKAAAAGIPVVVNPKEYEEDSK